MSGCDIMGADAQLLEILAKWRRSRVVILGVGNALRGDDGAGPALCERLSGRVAARIIDAGATPENHIGPVLEAAPDVLLIVDAVDFGGEPGQIRLCAADEVHSAAFSTHALSLRLFIDLIRRDRRPEVYVVGIQAHGTKLGDGLSPAVGDAVETLASAFLKALPAAGSS